MKEAPKPIEILKKEDLSKWTLEELDQCPRKNQIPPRLQGKQNQEAQTEAVLARELG